MRTPKKPDFAQKFLKKLDLPAWLRGLSTFQLKAAEGLQNALRDDTAQSTTRRVVACLKGIGLKPLIDRRILNEIMHLSRGNDLAFLYGLLTFYYTIKNPAQGKNYSSINEQLILSSICHLDMIPTLRELDRILPKGHEPIEVSERRKLERERRRTYESCNAGRNSNVNKNKNLSPYLQKLALPDCEWAKEFSCKRYLMTTTYPYEAYKDPLYQIANRDRWFANVKFQPNRRIVTKIIFDEVNRIFDDYDAVLEKAENTQIICKKDFCLNLEEMRKNMEHKLKEKYRRMGLLNTQKPSTKIRRKRVIQQLEGNIQIYVQKLRKDHNARLHKIGVLKRGRQMEHKIITVRRRDPHLRKIDSDFVPLTPNSSKDNLQVLSLNFSKFDEKPIEPRAHNCECRGESEKLIKPRDTHKCGGCYSTQPISNQRRDPTKSVTTSLFDYLAEIPRLKAGCDNPNENVCEPRTELKCPELSCAKLLQEQSEKLDYQENKETPTKTFFTAATEHTPYKFDYQAIYRVNYPENKKHILQEYFVKCLNSNSDTPRDIHGHPDVMGAAEKCFREMFLEGVEAKKFKYKNAQEEQEERIASGLENLPHIVMAKKYPQKFYDPDDNKLMDNMLKDALDQMRKNPYYVLATLPDAHKLPILRQWIRKRYGKRYTQEDCRKYLNESVKFFQVLTSKEEFVKLPKIKDLNIPMRIPYDKRESAMEQFESFRHDVFKILDEHIMQISRQFWFAMHPYLLRKSLPYSTYFAYMPSRVDDLFHYRLWKPNDYKDNVSAWKARRELKKSA